MNKDEILVPILTAINDLREEVRENRRAIQKNTEAIQINSNKIDENKQAIMSNRQAIVSLEKRMKEHEETTSALEKRMKEHEEASKKDRKAILDILCSYEEVTDKQYKENKRRIEKLEKKFATISI